MRACGISRTSLAIVLGALTTAAAAQTIDPVRNNGIDPAAATHTVVLPAIGEINGMHPERSAGSPANVLEDVPRSMNDKQSPVGCDNVTGADEISAACRRWLLIAGTP